jgi:hypothetical protein
VVRRGGREGRVRLNRRRRKMKRGVRFRVSGKVRFSAGVRVVGKGREISEVTRGVEKVKIKTPRSRGYFEGRGGKRVDKGSNRG